MNTADERNGGRRDAIAVEPRIEKRWPRPPAGRGPISITMRTAQSGPKALLLRKDACALGCHQSNRQWWSDFQVKKVIASQDCPLYDPRTRITVGQRGAPAAPRQALMDAVQCGNHFFCASATTARSTLTLLVSDQDRHVGSEKDGFHHVGVLCRSEIRAGRKMLCKFNGLFAARGIDQHG